MSKSAFAGAFCALFLAVGAAGSVARAQEPVVKDHFAVRFGDAGVVSLKRVGDAYDTDYIRKGESLGHVRVRYRMPDQPWQIFSTTDPKVKRSSRVRTEDGSPVLTLVYNESGWDDFFADVELTESFRIEGDALYWSIHVRNLTHKPLELGDVVLSLPFNSEMRWDKTISTTQRVTDHSFISGHGSFLFWMRPNGEGPFLAMTPVAVCPLFESNKNERNFKPGKLEYSGRGGVYIHAGAEIADALAKGGTWRLPATTARLSPRFSPDDEITWDFKFRWADGYDGVRDVLVEEGMFDVQVVPGMTVPVDLETRVAIRTKNAYRLVPEYPKETRVEDLGEKAADTRVYAVKFTRLGENKLTLEYGTNQYMALEFFVTEPLETVIKKRAAFIVKREQHKDPSKWYNGLFCQWDSMHKILRSPDDPDGLKDYIMAADDPGLCKAPFIAAKNVHYPDAGEVAAVEYYLKNFFWGKMQRTDKEENPYGVYGIDNWKQNRESGPADRIGWTGHLWRTFDYPHVIHLYWSMHHVAKNYPGLTKYLDKDGYLERAYGTAMAFFTLPEKLAGWSANEVGNYDEVVIPFLIEDLEAAGWDDKAARLRAEWEKKVEHFVNDRPNLFHSEFPFDPTGYESHQAFAGYAARELAKPKTSLRVKAADLDAFVKEEITGNIATHGWLETSYYQLGGERGLRYVSQMGGWALLDNALYQAENPIPLLRLGYAALLSSWVLINTGVPETNYGYWYPGPENDGAAGSGFIAQPFGQSWISKPQPRGPWIYDCEADIGFGGALRGAATIVVDDPLFGLIAYGGELEKKGDAVAVIPRDGLRKRFHTLLGGERLHLVLDRDGFAAGKPVEIRGGAEVLSFVLENRSGDGHSTALKVSGTFKGKYQVSADGKSLGSVSSEPGGKTVLIPVARGRNTAVVIRKLS